MPTAVVVGSGPTTGDAGPIEQRDALPRNATGRVQKYLLREPYGT